MSLFFLTSGLLLGWTFGANGAANLFGTAVETKMLRFRTAAILASLGMVLGAVLEGTGASKTLGQLGAINAIAGAFTVALAAGITLAMMAKLRLPGSTSQAIVGAIIGWNFFSGSPTDYSLLAKISLTWVLCPALAAIFALILFYITKYFLENVRIHLLTMDVYVRYALVAVGAFGSYSFGANNIANVMGVFVPSSPFKDITFGNFMTITSTQQLFFLGGIAIAVGVFTYSRRVMHTVGRDLFRLTPVTAFIVVLSHSLVLYFFSSQNLREWLISMHLPTLPLVPVSSSQAIIGGVIGIALAKGGRNLQWNVLGKIFSGWVTTPVIAGAISFFALFVVQNVFDQRVYEATIHSFPDVVIERLEREGVDDYLLESLTGMEFANTRRLRSYLKGFREVDEDVKNKIVFFSAIEGYEISKLLLKQVKEEEFTPTQLQDLYSLKSGKFLFSWELYDLLSERSDEWKYKPNTEENEEFNDELKRKYDCLLDLFRIVHK